MIALRGLVLIVQPIQQQPYLQTMQTMDYSGYTTGNITMRVNLVNLAVLVVELWHLFNDAVVYRPRE
jgi:hypothetical protein